MDMVRMDRTVDKAAAGIETADTVADTGNKGETLGGRGEG